MMTRYIGLPIFLVALFLGAAAVVAADMRHEHDDARATSVQDFYKEDMAKMHESMMAMVPSGDADVDFVRGMIPHHQGAIDMAKTVLAHGKDPSIRALAEGIVKAQESEIQMMNKWLEDHKKSMKE
jgi:uncharacterized protein (DUF305 family)